MVAAVVAALLSSAVVSPAISARADEGASPAVASAAADVIVDNTDAQQFTSTVGGKPWTVSSGLPNYYGTDYAYADAGSGGTARWTPSLASAGEYGVYYWIPDGNSARATNAPFTVHDTRGDYTYSVNEQPAPGGKWVFLGNHVFDAGSSGYVQLSASANGIVIADAIKFGAPQQETITTQIKKAKAYGLTEVTIDPGVYWQSSALVLDQYPGMTIHAENVRLILSDSKSKGMAVTSNGVTVTGLTIDYNPFAYTQGRVTDKAADNSWMIVKISDGFRKPNTLTGRVITWDGTLRLQKSFSDSIAMTWVDQAAGTIKFSEPNSAMIQYAPLGTIVTIADGASSQQGISVDGTDVTLRNVALRGAPGMGLMNAVGGGNLHLDGFQLVPPPRPSGATEDPIMSSVWDATQFQAVKKGPTIENSTIVNAGDDTFSTPGIGPLKLLTVSDDTVTFTMDGTYRRVFTGDRLQQWEDGPVATITALSYDGSTKTATATLDKPSPWPVGTQVTSPDRMANDFVFTNNRIDSSGRGLLVKSNHGVITNNWIRGAQAVSIASEISSNSMANAGGHILISGNTFLSSLGSGGGIWNSCQRGTVGMDSSPTGTTSEPLYPDITITDNTFQDIRGLNLSIANASGVTVENNRFLGSQRVSTDGSSACTDIWNGAVVNVTKSDDVSFAGNHIDWIGPYSNIQVHVDPSATNVDGLPDGVVVDHPYAAVTPGHAYVFGNQFSNRLLTSTGTGVAQKSGASSPTQGWTLQQVNTSTYYQIIEQGTGKVLTAAQNTTTVSLAAPAAGQWSQMWQLLDARDGLVKIVNRLTGKFLTTNGNTAGDGAVVGQYDASRLISQTWSFTDATPQFTADAPPAGPLTVGTDYAYTFAATSAVAGPITYSAAGELGSLAIDAATGVLSGVPEHAGRYGYTVTASNGYATVSGAPHIAHVRPKVDRAAGDDRFATSVEVSKSAFPGTAPIVFLASGSSFADALSATPAAARLGGPVLLTAQDGLPASVATELARLRPATVVIVGGGSAVSGAVLRAVQGVLPHADVQRVSGDDRFATSRAIASFAFLKDGKPVSGVTGAFIATGRSFPDALAAGAAIGSAGPVILVDGAATTLDTATSSLLGTLDPGDVWIAGGANAVSSGIEKRLADIYGENATRLAGDDRFSTAVSINAAFHSGTADGLMIATGLNYPDALAGGAWAAAIGAPPLHRAGNVRSPGGARRHGSTGHQHGHPPRRRHGASAIRSRPDTLLVRRGGARHAHGEELTPTRSSSAMSTASWTRGSVTAVGGLIGRMPSV